MAYNLGNFFKPSKTYKNIKNLEKAVSDIPEQFDGKPIRYIISQTEEGRFFPVFIGIHVAHLAQHGFCVAN